MPQAETTGHHMDTGSATGLPPETGSVPVLVLV